MKSWRHIQEDGVSASYGLATDEYLMDLHSEEQDQVNEATLRLYTYQEYCALVGRFQNIHAELDLDTCKKENIQYSRRLTGGGAIIMGNGQLGICLATANTFHSGNTRELYRLYSAPVITALDQIGITAKLKGKNDLEVDGKKIAGLGIHVNEFGAIQFHTSLLVDLDITNMLNVLHIPLQKIGDKSQIHKVEQRITTVSRELGRHVSIDEIRTRIKNCYQAHFKIQLVESELSSDEKLVIDKIAKERYLDQDWIFQNTPQPDMTGMGLKKTKAGLLRTYVALKGETIKSVLITGDFFGLEELFRNIEARLKWHPIDKDKMRGVVTSAFKKYNGQEELESEEVFNAIWRATLGAMKEVQYNYSGSCYYPKKKGESVEDSSIKEKELVDSKYQ